MKIKRKQSPESQTFWQEVETVAAEVKTWPSTKKLGVVAIRGREPKKESLNVTEESQHWVTSVDVHP